MLPAFDNIVRLTEHGDASFYGNPWEVGHLTNGMLVLYSYYPNGKGETPFISVPPESIDRVALFALR